MSSPDPRPIEALASEESSAPSITEFDAAAAGACDQLAARRPGAGAPSLAISMVRNEEDIIERFVRHTLSCVDALIVIDHGSADATPSILKQLVAEGLLLAVIDDSALGRYQGERVTRVARAAAARLHVHPIVPLDADEFLIPARAGLPDLPKLLKELPADDVRVITWRSYIPTETDPVDEVDVLKRMTHRLKLDGRVTKVIVGGALAHRSDFRIPHGSHQVVVGTKLMAELNEDRFRLAHFPVRSVAQMAIKLVQQLLAAHVTRYRQTRLGAQYSEFNLSPLMSHESLRRAALRYGLRGYKDEESDVELVYDPVPTPPRQLRYFPSQQSSFLQVVDSFARSFLQQARGGDKDDDYAVTRLVDENAWFLKKLTRVERKLRLTGETNRDLTNAKRELERRLLRTERKLSDLRQRLNAVPFRGWRTPLRNIARRLSTSWFALGRKAKGSGAGLRGLSTTLHAIQRAGRAFLTGRRER
jgi:hypothetical protein